MCTRRCCWPTSATPAYRCKAAAADSTHTHSAAAAPRAAGPPQGRAGLALRAGGGRRVGGRQGAAVQLQVTTEVILPLLLLLLQPRHCRPLQRGDLRDCGRHLRGEELGPPRHPRRAVVEPGAGAAASLHRPGLVTSQLLMIMLPPHAGQQRGAGQAGQHRERDVQHLPARAGGGLPQYGHRDPGGRGLEPGGRAHGGPGPAVPAARPRQGDDRGADDQLVQVHILGGCLKCVLMSLQIKLT